MIQITDWINNVINTCNNVDALTNSTFSGLVTSNGEFKFVDGNPQKKPFIISFKGNMEVVVE